MMTNTGVEPGDVLCAALKGMRFGTTEVLDAHWSIHDDWQGYPSLYLDLDLSEPLADGGWPVADTTEILRWVREHARPLLAGRLGWYTRFVWPGADEL